MAQEESLSLVLASASPRRKTLLEQAGVTCWVTPAHVDESPLPGETPEKHVLRLAQAKAMAVAAAQQDALVLGADTIVILGKCVFGKPGSMAEAGDMLRRLSGTVHHVLTGVCLTRQTPPFQRRWVARTTVCFRPLTDDIIDRYLSLVNPLDKAGAYGIQERGEMLVDHIDGLRSTVVGLPIEEVLSVLQSLPAP